MNILVTGCAGFVGYNVSDRLLKEGNKVIGVDNLNDDYDIDIKRNRIKKLREFKRFEFIRLDILNEGLPSLLKNKRIKYLIHLAAKDVYSDFSEEKDNRYSRFLDTNVTGTSKMFELAHQLKVKKFVHSSTYSIYGKTRSTILNERVTNLRPISPHGASKLAAEQVIHFMQNYYGVPSVILRLSSVYGPGMRPFTMIPKVIDRIRRGKDIDMYSDDVTRDYIYIDDVVEYIVSSLKLRGKYQIINVCYGESFSVKEVSRKIAKIMGTKEKINFIREKRNFNKLLMKNVRMSNNRAKKLMRYSPKVSIDEGLSLTISWYLNHEDILAKSVRKVS